MRRRFQVVCATWIFAFLTGFCVCARAQQQPAKPKAPAEEQNPPEEDEAAAAKEYSFNPLQASKEIRTGDFYFKKGKYRAAAGRYQEAAKWNGTLAEAYLKLGKAEEKQNEKKAAHEAYAKYLELAPEAKDAREIKKKIGKL
ncbi:MAG: tetratricopeptide repeat protein [Acidobacteriota bacterium]|nr:tetratricopeptide repeat protein [Acidobacteriota bacterium]